LHDPDERVHCFVVGVNEPVASLVLNVTVPVGLNPFTVAVQVVDAPAMNVRQDTEVDADALLTVIDVVPELFVLFELPGYDAVIVGVPAMVSMYVTVQVFLFAEVEHDSAVNDEPVPSVNEVEPVGTFPVVTAVQVVALPTVNVDGAQESVVVVEVDLIVVVVILIVVVVVLIVVVDAKFLGNNNSNNKATATTSNVPYFDMVRI
jgi:hypothetical protein